MIQILFLLAIIALVLAIAGAAAQALAVIGVVFWILKALAWILGICVVGGIAVAVFS